MSKKGDSANSVGLQLVKVLFKSPYSEVGLGLWKDQFIVFKKVSKSFTDSETYLLRREYEILRSLDHPNILKAIDLIEDNEFLYMILEDFQAIDLRAWVRENASYLESDTDGLLCKYFYPTAFALGKALGEIHSHRLIHKDIHPMNVLVSSDFSQIKLCDFSLSARAPRFTVERNARLEGYLPYISPEQTGRMNRGVDYRTDIYSLGATFYFLLTGQDPFQCEDDLGYISAHLSQTPKPLSQFRPDFPEWVQRIVEKLMAKNSEDRYQSTYGLMKDLEALTTGTPLERLGGKLGRYDVPLRLILSEKLYGRQRELDLLKGGLSESHRLLEPRVALLGGAPGIGKTALVNEFQTDLVRLDWLFVSVKFDQFRRDIGFDGVRGLLNSLAITLLGMEERSYQDLFTRKLGPRLKSVFDIAPKMEPLFGTLPALTSADSEAEYNRTVYALAQFLEVFVQEIKPLVIFLDDLQWSDRASLDVIRTLTELPGSKRLFLIGSYRTGELEAQIKLLELIEHWKRSNGLVEVELAELSAQSVNQLLSDSLFLPSEETLELSRVLFEKTRGNPFFLRELCQTLYAEREIEFSQQAGRWSWNLSRIREIAVSANVIEFAVRNLESLPETCLKALGVAACLSVEFDLILLPELLGISLLETRNILWPAIQLQTLMIACGGNQDTRDYEMSLEPPPRLLKYRFGHDKVMELCQKRLTPEQFSRVSYQKAKFLQETGNASDRSEVLTIAEAYSHGYSELQAGDEDGALRAFLSAIQIAGASKNFEKVLIWSDQAETILSRRAASEALLFDLLRNKANAFKHLKREEEMNQTFERLEVLPLSSRERLEVHCDWVRGSFTFDMGRSYGLVSRFRAEHGMQMPRFSSFLIIKELVGMIRNFKALDEKQLFRFSKGELLDWQKFYTASSLSLRANRPTEVAYLICKSFNLSSQTGRVFSLRWHLASSLTLVYSLSLYSLIGKRHQLLRRVMKEFPADAHVNIASAAIGATYGALEEGLPRAATVLDECQASCLEAGEIETYLTSAHLGVGLRMLLARSADDLLALSRSRMPLASEDRSLRWAQSLPRLVRAMALGDEAEMEVCNSISIEARAMGPVFQASDLYHRNLGHVINGEFEKVCFDPTGFEVLRFCYLKPVIKFIEGLAASFLLLEQGQTRPKAPESHTKKKLSKVFRIASRELSKFSKSAKTSEFKAMAAQIEAERLDQEAARIKWPPWFKKFRKQRLLRSAIVSSQLAIALAKESGLPWLEGIIAERAAEIARRAGYEALWKSSLERALTSFEAFGATKRVKSLLLAWPMLKAKTLEPVGARVGQLDPAGVSGSRDPFSSGSHAQMDYLSVVKTARVISEEIHLEALLKGLLGIIKENAGADRVQIFLVEENEAYLEAEQVQLEPPVLFSHLPLRMLDQSAKQPLLLVQKSRELQVTPRSLIFPILHEQKVSALILLENRVTEHVFTQERVETLVMLGSQVAAAIENARLYKTLERKVEERTQEVQAILQKIHQGIFVVGGDCKIDSEYSNFCLDLLEESSLESRDALDVLLSGTELSEDEISQARATLVTSVGGPIENLEMNSHLLPSRITRKGRVLEIDWNGISDTQDQVEAVMVVIRDVTHEVALDQKVKAESEKLKQVGEILKATPQRFLEFRGEADEFLKTARELDFKAQMRRLHTLKGNARSLGLKKISDVVHYLESQAVRSETPHFEILSTALTEYSNTYALILGAA